MMDDSSLPESFDPGEVKFLIDELAFRLAELEKPMQPGDFTVPQAVAELQFLVGRLEKAENKRLADLEDRVAFLEEITGPDLQYRLGDLERRLVELAAEVARLKPSAF